MRKKALALTLMMAFSCFLGGGDLMGQTRAANYDFSATTLEGVTLYYKINAEPSNTVIVTYPNGSASSGSSAYTGYTKPTSNTAVTIPSIVRHSDTDYTVIGIDKWAFYNWSYLTSVTIPDGILSIGESAFQSCSNMTSASLPSDLISIGNNAFKLCSKLGSVSIPNTVNSIGNEAFYNCNSTTFTTMTIPSSVTVLNSGVFQNCNKLNTITLPSGLTTIGQNAFNGCYVLSNVDIPNTVNSIGNNAFKDCKAFTTIIIPNSVTSLGTNVYQNCEMVTSITIGDGISTIPNYTFYGCKASGLTSITLPENILSIGNNAFSGCSNLTTITGSNVTSLGTEVFSSCTKLTTANFPKLTSIGTKAFSGCTQITSVTIPSTVTTISTNPYYSCTGLNSITVAPGNTKFTSGDGANCIVNTTTHELITGCPYTTIPEGVTKIGDYAFYNYNSLTYIDIPNTVQTIGIQSFYGCKLSSIVLPSALTTINSSAFAYNSLNSIIIPSNTTKINDYAFQYCASLKSVTILRESSIPTLGSKVFYKNASYIIDNLIIYVPSTQVSTYKEATNWSTYASNIDDTGVIMITSSEWTSASAGAHVCINTDCTIPTSTSLNVNNVIISNGVTLTIANGASLTASKIENLGTVSNLIIADGGQLICNNSVAATVQKSIEASDTPTSKGAGWYTISSPVNNATIASVTNLVVTDPYKYDLYRFNETKDDSDEDHMRWENYKKHGYTNFENGRGYIYRKNNSTAIEFVGNTNVGSVTYALTYSDVPVLAGFNLIGNPYPHSIAKGNSSSYAIQNGDYLATNYYILSNNDTWYLCTDGDEIPSKQGILVKTVAAWSDFAISDVAYTPVGKSHNDNIRFSVKNKQFEDVAYAWFDKGHGLPKIAHRNPNAPMLYIPQDGTNYATAIMDDNTETFGLSFKAMTMGKYTLRAKANGDYSYLHVIDRLTGEDVDMLLEDEYSFVASPSDNDDRFIVRLSYNGGNVVESDNFAYQSGNEIFVSGEGELQVFDVTGRKVMNVAINEFETISGLSKGVYIFRLIGETQKTQKIVVR